MSSFVISKEEYVKAAGIVAAVASVDRNFWLYDYKENRNSTEQDIYNRFVDCYKMNSISVSEQYGDNATECDCNKYTASFAAAYDYGRQRAYHDDYKTLAAILRKFFSSALYQTEKQEYSVKMELFFSRIMDQIIGHFLPETDSWGSIDIA